MTLRARLTIAFLAVVLGPVLLGAFFVGATVAAVSHQRSAERLSHAATTVRISISSLCQQLHATANAVAVAADQAAQARVAAQIINQGLASAVLVADATGATLLLTPDPPPGPWADCGGADPTESPLRAIAARVELRDAAGAPAGTIWSAQVLDTAFFGRLAAATGTAVTLLRGDPALDPAAQSTEPSGSRESVLAAADRVAADGFAEAEGGRYITRIGPTPGQPLPLVLSVSGDPPRALYAVLAGTVLLAGLLALLTAIRLARSTTRPLTELARAADRVADGDLAARVPVHAPDEVGRLASTFNRMTRETQSYLQALTLSRDQLRGHLAVLGDTLASTHDLQRILQVIMKTAVAATGARAGLVLLLDQGTGNLVSQYAENLPGVLDPDAPPIPFGTGLLGTVAATGEPRRGRVDRDGPTLSAHEPHCHTYIAVPFSAPASVRSAGPVEHVTISAVEPATLGVLALYNRHGFDEFDDTDLITLRTFARHAAVAVDNVRVHEEAQRLSLTDPLTGLWNYRYLTESVRREVERASRFGRMLSVLALDLDRFKEVNDTYGHAAGDAVLAEFARRIRNLVREVDLAFRRGGEEFVVLLPETDARGAATVAERLGATVRDTPIAVGRRSGPGPNGDRPPISVTVSIGIAVYPDHALTGAQVLDAADEALYAAKAAGRDTHRLAGGPGGASCGAQPPRPGRGR